MKRTGKFLVLFLTAVIMANLYACRDSREGEEKNPAAGTTTAKTESVETASKVDSNGFIKDNLPDDLNFEGRTVNILYWSDAERQEFTSDGISGSNINDAIYHRNMSIEDRLRVKLNFIGQNGNAANGGNFVTNVKKSFDAGDNAYDIVATYSRTAGMCAVDGYFADLHSIDDSYIDESMPWWPQSVTETMVIGNSLYFITGDASTNTLHFMYTIYYNKDLLTSYGLDDPTEYVRNHTWTLDKLIEMSSNIYQDLDSDGAKSLGDFYGFCNVYYHNDAFYTGSGLMLVEQTGDDSLLKISDDFFSERCVNLIDKVGKWLTSQDCRVSTTSEDSYEIPFVNGNAFFCQNRVYMADNIRACGLNAVSWTYGLVPTPLFDLSQPDYITTTGNPFTLYSIMADCREQTVMTTVIECWGSEAYRLTTPALFEVNMKYKYSQEEISAQMFDILRRTQVYDLGRVFCFELASIPNLPDNAMATGGSWTTIMKANEKALLKMMDKLVGAFKKIQ